MEISGGIVDYIGAFGAGVLVSFSPCVYPVMPLTASYIAGANAGGTRTRAFLISLVYVLGMAIVYTALAVGAALTGKIFGQIQSSAWLHLVVGILLIVLALMMFDKIPMPALGKGAAGKAKPYLN